MSDYTDIINLAKRVTRPAWEGLADRELAAAVLEMAEDIDRMSKALTSIRDLADQQRDRLDPSNDFAPAESES